MTPLRIGRGGFALPIELVTSTQAILARKRSGKSYTASIQAEELRRHKQQIAAIDPTGAWWGLRSLATGCRAGTLECACRFIRHPLNASDTSER